MGDGEKAKQEGQVTFDGDLLEERLKSNSDEALIDPETLLEYFGLKEVPTKGRDFINTYIVDRAYKFIKNGVSVRLLGDAGIGKSATIRALKAKLLADCDKNYIVPVIEFRPLVDPNERFITRDGLRAIGLHIVKELNNHYRRQHKRWPFGYLDEHRAALKKGEKEMGPATRSYWLEDMFEKLKEKDMRFVIMYENSDSLQWFTNYELLNWVGEQVHAVLYSHKPSEERASQKRAMMKEKDELHEEVKARRQQQKAYLRRSKQITIPGQPGDVLLQIMHGKMSKKLDLLTNEAIAWGFKAAYCGRAPSGIRLDVYIDGLKPNQLLYNPDKAGHFLEYCLELGCAKGVEVKQGCIDASIAKVACVNTIKNLDFYDAVDAPGLDTHAKEFESSWKKLNDDKS